MNNPQDIEKNEQHTTGDNTSDNIDPTTAEHIDGDTSGDSVPIAPQIFAESLQNGPQWYGVSYQNQGGPVYTDYAAQYGGEPSKPNRKKRIAVIAVCIAIAVLLSGLAGFGGAMLYNNLLETDGLSNTDQTTNNPTLELDENIHSNEENTGYDYGSVTLEKNDGSTLVESVTGSAGDRAMTPIEATAVAKNSVVEIMTTVSSGNGSVSAGAGSGVIIHADGIIVTNNHVIEGAQRVYVRLTNGNTYEATVRGTDEDGDIAVIKIAPKEALTVAKLGYSGALIEGEEVLAIGNPLGELGGTVTNGIISCVEREVQVGDVTMTLLQTNAAINSGNSGGGLFNLAGELIGIVNAKYSATGVEGLGFAIPIDTAMISINQLLTLGYIPDIPSMGIVLAEGSVRIGPWPYTIREVVYVYDAVGHGQFKNQDIVVSVDGVNVSTLPELKRVVRSHKVGDVITVVVQRNNQNVSLNVTLIEHVPTNAN